MSVINYTPIQMKTSIVNMAASVFLDEAEKLEDMADYANNADSLLNMSANIFEGISLLGKSDVKRVDSEDIKNEIMRIALSMLEQKKNDHKCIAEQFTTEEPNNEQKYWQQSSYDLGKAIELIQRSF
jgi:Rad3-related DNA helicase